MDIPDGLYAGEQRGAPVLQRIRVSLGAAHPQTGGTGTSQGSIKLPNPGGGESLSSLLVKNIKNLEEGNVIFKFKHQDKKGGGEEYQVVWNNISPGKKTYLLMFVV